MIGRRIHALANALPFQLIIEQARCNPRTKRFSSKPTPIQECDFEPFGPSFPRLRNSHVREFCEITGEFQVEKLRCWFLTTAGETTYKTPLEQENGDRAAQDSLTFLELFVEAPIDSHAQRRTFMIHYRDMLLRHHVKITVGAEELLLLLNYGFIREFLRA